MALTEQSKVNVAFKKLLGRAHSGNPKEFYNEAVPSHVQLSVDTIFADPIDSDPSVSVAAGVSEFVIFDLVLDPTSNGLSYRAHFPSSHPTLAGQPAQHLIPQSYGLDYRAILVNGGSEIPPLDPRDWVLDYANGVIVSQVPLNLGVGTLEAYHYIGRFVEDILSASGEYFIMDIATTEEITLSGEQSVDGVLTSGSKVLVKDQSNLAENGLYLSDSGSWTRIPGFDTPNEFIKGARVFVESGTLYNNSEFVSLNEISTLGTDPVVFDKVNDTALTESLNFDLTGPGAYGLMGPITLKPRVFEATKLIPEGGPVQVWGEDYGLVLLNDNNGIGILSTSKWYISLTDLATILTLIGGTGSATTDSIGANQGILPIIIDGEPYRFSYEY